MKKIKILSVLLVVAMMIGILTGCDSVSKKDIESNPKACVEEAVKKSLAKSPFGGLLELKNPEATSIDFSIDDIDEDLSDFKFGAVIANDGSGLLLDLSAKIDGQSASGKLFLDNANFAIKIAELKDIFGTDSVGVSFKDFEKEFKDSPWYDLLIVQSGMEEEFKSEGLDEIDFKAVIDAYEKYIEDLKQIEEDCRKFSVSETTIENGKKKIKCFAVEETLDSSSVDKMKSALKAFTKDFAKSMGVPSDELDIDEDLEEFEDIMKQIVDSYKVTYVIEKKTGALMTMNATMKATVESEIIYAEPQHDGGKVEKSSIGYDVNLDFGKDPTNIFAPSFEIKMYDGDMTTTFSGQSKINTSKKEFVLNAKYSEKYNDEEMAEWFDEEYTAQFTLNQDDKYKITLSDGDDKIDFGGTFKVDGSKMEITIDVSEIEDAEMGDIKIFIDFNATKPSCFKYENLLAWDEEQVNALIEKFESMNEPEYNDDMYY